MSEKSSYIYAKYTYSYNGTNLVFCMAIKIVSFIEFLMECCIHADICIIIAERYMIYRDTVVWEKFAAKKFSSLV